MEHSVEGYVEARQNEQVRPGKERLVLERPLLMLVVDAQVAGLAAEYSSQMDGRRGLGDFVRAAGFLSPIIKKDIDYQHPEIALPATVLHRAGYAL